MNSSYIALAHTLRALHIKPTERRFAQHAIYVAQQLGLPLGYDFMWSIRAPYSEDLSEALNELTPEDVDGVDGVLREPYRAILDGLNAGLSQWRLAGMVNKAECAELFAVTAYEYQRCDKNLRWAEMRVQKYRPHEPGMTNILSIYYSLSRDANELLSKHNELVGTSER